MAAPLRCMTYCRLSFGRFLSREVLHANTTSALQCSTVADIEKNMEEEIKADYEREVARLRDVSNLPKFQKNRHRGVFKENFLGSDDFTSSRRFYRKMYAVYGEKSGLDPSKLWPSKEEMQSLIEDDQHWEPTFQEMMAKIQTEKEEKQVLAKQRDIDIEKAMGNMDKLIKDYQQRLVKAAKEEKKTSDINLRLLSEFRDRYGYSVPEKSYRFREFKKERMEEQKKMKKMEKKQEKIEMRKKFEEGED